jgi:hypothetical protein
MFLDHRDPHSRLLSRLVSPSENVSNASTTELMRFILTAVYDDAGVQSSMRHLSVESYAIGSLLATSYSRRLTF